MHIDKDTGKSRLTFNENLNSSFSTFIGMTTFPYLSNSYVFSIVVAKPISLYDRSCKMVILLFESKEHLIGFSCELQLFISCMYTNTQAHTNTFNNPHPHPLGRGGNQLLPAPLYFRLFLYEVMFYHLFACHKYTGGCKLYWNYMTHGELHWKIKISKLLLHTFSDFADFAFTWLEELFSK